MHYFTHTQLLPTDTMIQIDDETCTLVLMQTGECVTRQQFTESEFLLLNLFFRESGVHCTFAEALAECINEPLVECEKRVQNARQTDQYEESVKREAWRAEMQPVITVLKQCRDRLHALHLDVVGLHQYGYTLFPWKNQQQGAIS